MKIRVLKLRKTALALTIFLGFMMILSTTAFSDTTQPDTEFEESEVLEDQSNSTETPSEDAEIDDSEMTFDLTETTVEPPAPEDGDANKARGGVYSNPQAVTASQAGSASFTYLIDVPPGRNGLQPKISLQYSSSNGNGWLGVGWDLNMGTISRSTRYGLHYDIDEYTVDGADLVSREDDWGAGFYGAKIEGAFTKYEFVSGSNYWKATAKDGTEYYYGSRFLSDPNANSRMDNSFGTYSWYLDKVEDTNGNYIAIDYTIDPDRNQIYLDKIYYTGNTNGFSPKKTVEFDLEARDDIISSYKTKSFVETAKRLKTITVIVNGATAYNYELIYENSANNGRSRLTQIKREDPDGNSLPPYVFSYLDGGNGTFGEVNTYDLGEPSGLASRNNHLVFGDINGDGRQDFIKVYSPDDDDNDGKSPVTVYPFLSNDGKDPNVVEDFITKATWEQPLEECEVGKFNPNIGNTMMSVSLGDVNGDGMADIMSNGLDEEVHVYLSRGDGTFSAKHTTKINSGDKINGVFLADVNGDNLSDLITYDSVYIYSALSNGDGEDDLFGTKKVTPLGSGSTTWTSSGMQMQIADFDGDGMSDILTSENYYIYNGAEGICGVRILVRYGDGDGNFINNVEVVNVSWPATQSEINWVLNQTTSDVNGDGLADIAYVTPGSGYFVLHVYLSTGSGFSDVELTQIETGYYAFSDIDDDGMSDLIVGDHFYKSNGDGTFSEAILSGGPGTGGYFLPPLLADFDGDGRPDYIYYDPLARLSIEYSFANGDDAADCIDLVTNPNGGKTEITYSNSSEFENNKIPFVVHPVTHIKFYTGIDADGIDDSTPDETSYDYKNGYYDYAERDFRGFGYVKQTNPDFSTVETEYEVRDNYIKGKPLSIIMKESEQDTPFKETTNTWLAEPISNTNAQFVNLNFTTTKYENNDNYKTSETYYYYDENGLPKDIYKNGTDANGSAIEKITQHKAYDEFSGDWTWRLIEETVSGAATGPAKKMTYYYDGYGNLTHRIFWRTSTNAYPAIRYDHDPYGNVEKEWTEGYNNYTTIEYDTATQTFPHIITNALDQETTKTWNYKFGKEDTVVDPNNNYTVYTYDPFGRSDTVTNFGFQGDIAGYTDIDYHDDVLPVYVHTKILETGDIATGSYVENDEYFDGLGRTIKVITDGIDESGADTNVITTTKYDDMGRKWLVEGPYFSGHQGSGYYEKTLYDKQGRVTDIESPTEEHGPIHILYTYSNPFKTEITDPDGKKKTEIRDHLGRIIEVIEHAGDDIASPVLQTTGYEYNAAGDMTGVINALNISTDITYDLRGLKTSMDDPDMGKWFYTYDGNGNLDTQLDAKGILIDFDYDALNRIEFKTYTIPVTDPLTAATSNVEYSYDGEGIPGCLNCIGQLTSVDSSDVYTEYDEFDPLDRAMSFRKVIDDQDKTIETTYDKSGKVKTITYPDGFIAENYYYPGTGLLDEVTGTISGGSTESYTKCTGYEPTGKIAKIYHGYNGVETVYNYDPLSTRLMDIQTSGETSQGTFSVQDRAYSYTKAGDIREITDYHNGPIYTYTYDNLHRLLSETSTGEVPSARAEELIFTYDDDDKPNAVRNIKYNGNDFVFDYDDNGNMTKGHDFTDPNNIVERVIAWNADNMPVTVTRDGTQTTLTYDGDGVRAKKTINDSDPTYYISNDYEIKNGVATKYIFAGNLRVATIDDTNTYIFHKDHLGSSTAMTKYVDGSLEIEETSEYLPFGSMRAHTGDEVSDYKFTDQERDGSTNLYNYDARLYDPIIGRFTSADSIVPDWYDPQMLGRYTYSRNNPLKYVDPSGHIIHFAAGLSDTQKLTILGNMQKLTSDKLFYKGNEIKIKSLGSTMPKGTQLIRELRTSTKTVEIGIGSQGSGNSETDASSTNAINGKGSDTSVSFDPTSNPAIPTADPKTGNVTPTTGRPNQIGLGHELVHANRSMKGVAIDYSKTDTYTYKDSSGANQTQTVPKEELATVGLKHNQQNDVTENDLRREQLENMRGAY